MVFASLAEALRAYVKMPLVWVNGAVAALAILAVYYLTYFVNEMAGLAAMVIFFFFFPYFLAGTYGVLIDNNKKKGSVLSPARMPYPAWSVQSRADSAAHPEPRLSQRHSGGLFLSV